MGGSFAASVTAANFSTGCRLVEAGLGLAIMPNAAIPSGLGAPLVQRPLMEDWAERPLNVYASKKRPRTAGGDALLRHLRLQSRLLTRLRQEHEAAAPSARLESQFTVASLLPVTRGSPVGGAFHLVRTAELDEP